MLLCFYYCMGPLAQMSIYSQGLVLGGRGTIGHVPVLQHHCTLWKIQEGELTLGVCAPYPLHNRCIPYSSSKIECKDIPLVLVSLGRVGTSSSPSPSFLHTLASAASRTLSWSRGRSVPPPQCHRWSDPSDLLLGLERNSSKKIPKIDLLSREILQLCRQHIHTHTWIFQQLVQIFSVRIELSKQLNVKDQVITCQHTIIPMLYLFDDFL